MEEEKNENQGPRGEMLAPVPDVTGDETITDETNIEVADEIELAKEKKSRSKWRHFVYRLRKIFSIRDDMARHDEIKERIVESAHFTGANMTIMICAILIASTGLYVNSVAVVIGAMLISPLMNRILLMAYGTASNDSKLMLDGLKGFALQAVISITVATIYFLILPRQAEPTEQLLARTEPTVLDVVIAFFGGIAGIIGYTRKGQYNNVIPGVAIATAIMPPLCTVGYFLAYGQWLKMGMALYLFAINVYFIYMSAVIVLNILEVPKVKALTVREWRKKRLNMLRNTLIVLVPAILLMILHFTGKLGGSEEEVASSSEAIASALSILLR